METSAGVNGKDLISIDAQDQKTVNQIEECGTKSNSHQCGTPKASSFLSMTLEK